MTPELALPLLTTTPHQRENVSALDRRASLPYTAGLQWHWARTREKASQDPIPIPLGYHGHMRSYMRRP
ncbi:hypothetical protein TNCV_4114111 [Trichonephila clavipes]|nr:hypothetical protein TNCV_4114111 [Trichonephila clavipes]